MELPHYFGIDIGATCVKVGIVTRDGKLLSKEEVETGKIASPAHFIEASKEIIDRLLATNETPRESVGGIGVGAPGWVNYAAGIVNDLTNIPGWHNVPLAEELERETGLKSFVDNDANVMAVGEMVHGAGRKFKNFVCLTLGTGVGGAIIIDGDVYRGISGLAGEIGHMTLDMNGPLCACGARGCLERYVGNRYIVENALNRLGRDADGRESIILKMAKNDERLITPELLSKAAAEGDQIAIEVWSETGRYIGTALAVLVNLLNPECFIIGGGVAEAGEVLFSPMRKAMESLAMNRVGKSTPVLEAQLGEEAGVIGAATFAMIYTEKA